MRKVAARLMPVLLGLYIIAYLDRVNVTFAQDKLESDLGFSGAVYGFGAGIFFIGYFFLEVPSNLALHRFGARKWIARIMITWGIISACTMFVQGPLSFYAVRFLLGIAEAGFFPGMILYLSYWFPARERARAVGFFMSAIAISYAIGAPISGGDHVGVRRRRRPRGLAVAVPHRGDPGDRSPASSSSGSCDDGPRGRGLARATTRRRWLGRAPRGRGAGAPARASATRSARRSRTAACSSFGLLYFCMVVNVYGLSFWVGEIVDQIDGLGDVGKGFVTAIPYAVAIVGMVADLAPLRPHRRAQARRRGPASRSPPSRSSLSTVVGPVAAIAALAVGLFFLLGAHPVFWTMPAALLSGAAAAAGIALINSIGNLGGFVGPVPRRPGQGRDRLDRRRPGRARGDPRSSARVLATRVAHDPELERAADASAEPLPPRSEVARPAGAARSS